MVDQRDTDAAAERRLFGRELVARIKDGEQMSVEFAAQVFRELYGDSPTPLQMRAAAAVVQTVSDPRSLFLILIGVRQADLLLMQPAP